MVLILNIFTIVNQLLLYMVSFWRWTQQVSEIDRMNIIVTNQQLDFPNIFYKNYAF